METEAKTQRVDELRRKLSAICGPGRGAECQAIINELMAMHPRVEATPEQKDELAEATLKKFLRRPGLPSKENR